MRNTVMPVLLLLALASPATAEVYRCEESGRTVYQSRPCGGGEVAPIEERVSSVEMSNPLGEGYQERIQQRMEEQREANDRYREQANNQARIDQAEREGRVTRGMTPEQVRAIWGAPWESLVSYDENDNRCVTWYYGGAARSERPEATFCDGAVTTFRAYGR